MGVYVPRPASTALNTAVPCLTCHAPARFSRLPSATITISDERRIWPSLYGPGSGPYLGSSRLPSYCGMSRGWHMYVVDDSALALFSPSGASGQINRLRRLALRLAWLSCPPLTVAP